MNKRYANARHEAARGRLDSAGQSSIGSVQSSASKAADATLNVLGNSQAELGRLTFQAMILRPITERLFREAGITQGMRVLDLGCGPGDVSFLAAEIVGSSGCVIGIDRDPVAIALARDRARQQGIRNVAFEQTGIEEFSSAVQFDAVVGRCILVFQPDPPAFLRYVMRFIGPNGVLALHEISLRHRFRSNPTVSLWDRAGDWLVAGFNSERDVATRLVEHFMAADLRFPTRFAEIPIGGGASSPLYAWTAETIRSLLPAIAASGIATAGEISVETLEERLRDAVVAANAQVEFIPQICGWARLSRTHNGGAAGPTSI
jgi:ubiquinone/menaquinone biosynthesis C-methylase UbiE